MDCGQQLDNGWLDGQLPIAAVLHQHPVDVRFQSCRAPVLIDTLSDAFAIAVEAHEVKVIHVLVVDPDPRPNTSRKAFDELHGIKGAASGIDYLVHQQLGVDGFYPGTKQDQACTALLLRRQGHVEGQQAGQDVLDAVLQHCTEWILLGLPIPLNHDPPELRRVDDLYLPVPLQSWVICQPLYRVLGWLAQCLHHLAQVCGEEQSKLLPDLKLPELLVMCQGVAMAAGGSQLANI